MGQKLNKKVDKFLRESKHWRSEMAKLRKIMIKSKLEETFKWGLPCYIHNDRNIAIIQPFKACLGLMFFKGTLLKDPKHLMIANGPNSQASRRLEIRSEIELTKLAPAIKAFVNEAIAIEASGQKIKFKKRNFALPTELKQIFSQNKRLKECFAQLTPGRQRAYVLYFSGAKQSATRQSRIMKCVPRILAGKGLTDR